MPTDNVADPAASKDNAAAPTRSEADALAALDPNYVFRGKIHLLAAQSAHFSQQLALSDAKGATLVALVGVLSVNAPVDISSLNASALAFVACAALAVLFALWSIAPRVPRLETRRAIGRVDGYSWPGLCEQSLDAIAATAQGADADRLVDWIARSNAATARILLKKFKRLQIAFAFSALSIAPLIALLASRGGAP